MLSKLLMAVALLVTSSYAFAQPVNSPKYEIGLNAGAFVYQGDLSASAFGSLRSVKPVFSLYGNRNLDNYFAVRANLAMGSLNGDESKYPSSSWRTQRNFKFNTSVTELSAMIVFNPFGNNGDQIFTKLSPYVFAGAGYAFLNVNRDWSNMNRAVYASTSHSSIGLAEDSAHALPKGIFTIPVGVGLKYSLDDNWGITTELSYRYTFSDYIDGFSKAANPAVNDAFYSVTVGVCYTFRHSGFLNCPVF